MKRGFALLLNLLLLSSVVSAASLFEGSAWDEWLTGNQVLRLFKFRQASAPAAQVQAQTTTSEIPILPNVYLEPATVSVSAEEYNRLLRLHLATIEQLQKQKPLNFIIYVTKVPFEQLDHTTWSRLGLQYSSAHSYLVAEFQSGNTLIAVLREDGSIFDRGKFIFDKNLNIKMKGQNVVQSEITAALISLEAKNSGHLLTKECGIAQNSVSTLAKLRGMGDGFKPGTDTSTSGDRAGAAPTQEEIRNLQRFGPSGSRVNPGTGYVTQVFDQGGAAERQGCSNAQQRYQQQRMQQLQENQEQRKQANDRRGWIEGETKKTQSEKEKQEAKEHIERIGKMVEKILKETGASGESSS